MIKVAVFVYDCIHTRTYIYTYYISSYYRSRTIKSDDPKTYKSKNLIILKFKDLNSTLKKRTK